MDLNIARNGNVLIAEVSGRIDGITAREFEDAVSTAITDEDQSVICDLSAVPYVSSAGLRAVLVIAKRLSKGGTKFSVCGLQEPVAEVFRVSGFDKIVRTHGNREEALSAAQT